MAKLESTLKNMVLSLTGICLVAGGVLAGINKVTEGPIDEAKAKAKASAELEVLNGQAGVPVLAEANGFGGKIKVMVGVAPDGTILGYKVLEHAETPGLGDNCATWFKDEARPTSNIIGKVGGKLTVSKDGGEVDAITAATISSRAFLDAINSACEKGVALQAGAPVVEKVVAVVDTLNVDAASAATTVNTDVEPTKKEDVENGK